MNNFEKIKSFSKNKMTDFLYALLRSSCYTPKEYDCNKCVAKSLCDVDNRRDSRYSIKKWLDLEIGE